MIALSFEMNFNLKRPHCTTSLYANGKEKGCVKA